MAYVYRHIRLDKNQPFYIGIGNQSEYKRAYDCSKNKRNKIWLNIVAKSKYEVEVLFDELSWDEACEKEKEFIALYGRIDLKTGILANMTDGGDGLVGVIFTDEHKRKIGEKGKNKIYSEESRLKMSKSQMGNKKYLLRTTPQEEINNKISIANKGKVRSEEQKNNLKLYYKHNKHACLGRKLSEETRQKIKDSRKKIKVAQKDFSGNIIKIWESATFAETEGFSQACIWKCCNNLGKQHRGYKWEYYK
jgi:hypothetical protein